MEAEPKVPVAEFVLQRYRVLLARSATTKTTHRSMCFVIIAATIVWSAPSIEQVASGALLLSFLTISWTMDERSIRGQMYAIEESLAKRGPDEWEDFYIQSRYWSSMATLGRMWQRYEPLLWWWMGATLILIMWVLPHVRAA